MKWQEISKASKLREAFGGESEASKLRQVSGNSEFHVGQRDRVHQLMEVRKEILSAARVQGWQDICQV